MAGSLGRFGRRPLGVVGARRGDVVRGAGIVVAVLACVAASAAPGLRATAAPGPASARPAAPSPATAFRSVRTYQEVAVPVRLRIPSLGIDTRLQRLGLAADGTIAAPTRWEVEEPQPPEHATVAAGLDQPIRVRLRNKDTAHLTAQSMLKIRAVKRNAANTADEFQSFATIPIRGAAGPFS